MIIDRKARSRRRGISGIIAAVMLFAMLFSVGTSYFLSVNNNDFLYSQAASNRNTAVQSGLAEDAVLSATLNSVTSVITFAVSNSGSVALNIIAFFVTPSSGSVVFCQIGSASPPCPTLPVVVNPGSTTSEVSTGVPYASPTNYTIRAVTQRGNTFVTTYPPTATALAAQALSSGAIGDLYLSFQSYTYFTVYKGGTCPSGGVDSGYCLLKAGKAFAISSTLTGPGFDVAFSVSITNYNAQHSNIVLDSYTLMSLVPESGKGSLGYVDWYIVSNSSNVILSSYTKVVLKYDVATTVVFASSVPLSTGSAFTSTSLQATGTMAAGTTTPVFMVSHGCEAPAITTCVTSQANYGQNSPYVTTLFY